MAISAAPTWFELLQNASVVFAGNGSSLYTYTVPTQLSTSYDSMCVVRYNGSGMTISNMMGNMSATISFYNTFQALVANSSKTVSVYSDGNHTSFPQLEYSIQLPAGTYSVTITFSSNMSSTVMDTHNLSICAFQSGLITGNQFSSSNTSNVYLSSGMNLGIGGVPTNSNAFQVTTASNVFAVRSSGYVGVGTSNPLAPLHVTGSTLVQAPVSANGFYINNGYGASNSNGIWAGPSSGASTTAYDLAISSWWGIGFYNTYSATNRIYMDTRLGNITCNGSIYAGGTITSLSDSRVKKDVQIIPNALEKVNKIRGYTFKKIDDLVDTRYTGLIAQELKEMLPEAVVEQADGYLSISYGNVVGLLVEAIRELSQKCDQLEKRPQCGCQQQTMP